MPNGTTAGGGSTEALLAAFATAVQQDAKTQQSLASLLGTIQAGNLAIAQAGLKAQTAQQKEAEEATPPTTFRAGRVNAARPDAQVQDISDLAGVPGGAAAQRRLAQARGAGQAAAGPVPGGGRVVTTTQQPGQNLLQQGLSQLARPFGFRFAPPPTTQTQTIQQFLSPAQVRQEELETRVLEETLRQNQLATEMAQLELGIFRDFGRQLAELGAEQAAVDLATARLERREAKTRLDLLDRFGFNDTGPSRSRATMLGLPTLSTITPVGQRALSALGITGLSGESLTDKNITDLITGLVRESKLGGLGTSVGLNPEFKAVIEPLQGELLNRRNELLVVNEPSGFGGALGVGEPSVRIMPNAMGPGGLAEAIAIIETENKLERDGTIRKATGQEFTDAQTMVMESGLFRTTTTTSRTRDGEEIILLDQIFPQEEGEASSRLSDNFLRWVRTSIVPEYR